MSEIGEDFLRKRRVRKTSIQGGHKEKELESVQKNDKKA